MTSCSETMKERNSAIRTLLLTRQKRIVSALTPMNIGLCYDLREDYLALGYSLEETAEFDGLRRPFKQSRIRLQARLQQQERIGNAFALVSALAQGKR